MICNKVQEDLIDYLEGNLNEARRKKVEEHLNECEDCKAEMRNVHQMAELLKKENDLVQIPQDFMKNVKHKVIKTQKSRGMTFRHRAVVGMVAALFLTVFVGTAVATSFSNVMDWWRDLSNKQDEQMEGYVQHGVGEQLNIETENNGVKVTVTNVVADDIQTLIYYEVEDMSKENNYMINYTNGLNIANQDVDWSSEDDPTFSPVTSHLSLYSEKDNVFKGRLGLLPMLADEGTIQLELSKLEKVISDISDKEVPQSVPKGDNHFIEGDWHFEIPVKKHPSTVHDIHIETEIEGNPVIFDKLTIAPTVTVLSYRYRNENPDKRMEYIQIASLESNGKKVFDQLGLGGYTGSGGSEGGWNSAEATFESLYFEKPKDIQVHLGSAAFSIQNQANFEIDPSKKLPQTFKYLGNIISIEQMEIGTQTKIVMKEELNSNRGYEMLNYRIFDKDGQGSSGARVDGYFIDKDGNKYKADEYFYRLNGLEQPRFFSTDHYIELSSDDKQESFIPYEIEIEGYTNTLYLDQTIEISLD